MYQKVHTLYHKSVSQNAHFVTFVQIIKTATERP